MDRVHFILERVWVKGEEAAMYDFICLLRDVVIHGPYSVNLTSYNTTKHNVIYFIITTTQYSIYYNY